MRTNATAVVSFTGRRQALMRDYLSLIKVGITVSNLVATFAGYWVACQGRPDLRVLGLALLGTGLVITSGTTLNNYLDRDIDPLMQRTRDRALVAGRVRPEAALRMGVVCGLVGLAVLSLFVNVAAAACALAGLVVYVVLYTLWWKRTTPLSTVLGGVSGAMPPLIGWAAATGSVLDPAAWAIFGLFFLWQPPHFWPLAMKRVEEYRRAGIPMLPVVRGFRVTKRYIFAFTGVLLPVSLLPYGLGVEGIAYLIVALLLGFVFLGLALQGLCVSDDLAWVQRVFRYSLFYLIVMCAAMIIGIEWH
jgi:protoheme IX farnesyltransferase